jgi:hypothetical protein
MTRSLITLVALGVAGFGYRGGSSPAAVANEPPPPLVEADLEPGSRLVSRAPARSSRPSPGALALKFAGCEKARDALRRIAVATWLERPDEPVTLSVTMQSPPNGLNYPGSIVLSIPESKIVVRITKSHYQKLAQSS